MRNSDNEAYKDTEYRLYRYKTICTRINDHKRNISELKDMNPNALWSTSHSVLSLNKNKKRSDISDAFERQIGAVRTYIAADEYEIRQIRRALRTVRDDPYYMALELRYFRGMTDDEASRVLKCSPSTLRRNRTRLLTTVSSVLHR